MASLRSVLVAALSLSSVAAGCGKKGESTGADPGAAHPAKATEGAAGVAAASGAKDRVAPKVAPSRGPEHAVFSLADNRLLGHLQRGGGLVVAGASAGSAKYLRFAKSNPAWQTGEAGGAKALTMKSKAGALAVPLTAEQAAANLLRLRVHATAPQRLGLRLNGGNEVTTQLAAGWATVELPIPAGALRAGENELLFFAGTGFALGWLQVGGAAFGDEVAPGYDPAAKALALPDGGGAAWYVTVPDQGLVTGDLDDGACTVAVTLTPDGGAPITGALVGKGSAVDLAAAAGKPARLELLAEGCPLARLAGAALVAPGPAPTVKRGPAPKHVLMLVMDSLRADRMRAFNPKARAETPFLEELTAKGTAFTQFYVQGNETKCSHASLWTSLYPVVHKMIPPNSSIDPTWVTVEEVAQKAGLYTSGASGNGYIVPKRGFGDHWDAYRNHIHDGGGLRAEDIAGKGWASLAGKEKQPWFMYLGWIDTHVSWRAKEPWFSTYAPGPYSGPLKVEASGQLIEKVATGKQKLSDAEIERVRALYDSNVSYQDDQIRKLFGKLEELGIADETMVVMTADHGDELFEDGGRVGHGSSSRDSVVWVPGFLYYPPMVPAGRVPEGAELVDLVPTIADALGVEPDPAWQGESLIPLVNGVGRGYPRLSMSSKYENGHAARLGMWKVYWPGGGKPELYDVATDVDEHKNVAGEHPIALRMVADALWTLRLRNAEWKKPAWGNPANLRAGYAEAVGE